MSLVGQARTRVTLTSECEPRQQLLPQLGNAENMIEQHIVHDLAQFKKFIEKLTGDTSARREQKFIVCAELPGVRREDVHIEIKRTCMTCAG